jgi:hypothetical protein
MMGASPRSTLRDCSLNVLGHGCIGSNEPSRLRETTSPFELQAASVVAVRQSNVTEVRAGGGRISTLAAIALAIAPTEPAQNTSETSGGATSFK